MRWLCAILCDGFLAKARSASDQLAEFADKVFHGLSLGVEFLGCAGTFFGTGCIALGDFIHLAHGIVDLLDALGLF